MKNVIVFDKQGMVERALSRVSEHMSIFGGLFNRFADTSILSANRLTQEKWPQTKFELMLANMQLSKFTGVEGSSSIILIDQNLTKGPGDKVTFELDMPLSNAGGTDDSDIEGNEEAMDFFNFPVEIHERSHAVRSAGRMSEKRSAVKILSKATFALARWSAEQVDNDFVWGLSGLGNQNTYAGEGTSSILTINEKAPSANRIFFGGATVAGVLTEETSDSLIGDGGATDYLNYLMTTDVISKVKTRAMVAFPKLSPTVVMNGRWYYAIFLHPYQVDSIRAETSTSGWAQIEANANRRGVEANRLFGKDGTGRDRLFDGAVGVWDDVIMYSYERIELRTGGQSFDDPNTATNIIDANIVAGTSAVARALFCGSQAGVIGWGQKWKRYTKKFDYNRKPGTAMDALYGFSKTRFNDPGNNQNTNTAQEDYGVWVVDTAAAVA